MKKMLISMLLTFSTLLANQNVKNIKINKAEVEKYLEQFKEKSKEEKNNTLKNIIIKLINNDYKANTKEEKTKLLSAYLYLVSLSKGQNIDNNTKFLAFDYNYSNDTVTLKKLIYNIEDVPEVKQYIEKYGKEKTLKVISKLITEASKINFCRKYNTIPYSYILLNSGTKIKEEIYYKDKNGNVKLIYSRIHSIKECKK